MAGSDRVPDPNDSNASPGWKRANRLRERNGALLRVHTEVRAKTCLTPPTLLEMGMYQQWIDPGRIAVINRAASPTSAMAG